MNVVPVAAEKSYTTAQAAEYFNRAERTIRLWCVNGTLLAAKCRVEREKYGCWVIYIPQK
jgi:hypothetical protein